LQEIFSARVEDDVDGLQGAGFKLLHGGLGTAKVLRFSQSNGTVMESA
jgi:hypothetical protein